MGSSNWSDADYAARSSMKAAHGIPTFKHHDDVAKGKASGAHASLSPKGVKVRESRDSDAHPNSQAVAVLLDVTGSMSNVPRTVQQNLPKLMGLLLRKAYIPDPHILVGAIGDAYSDKVPLQVGQFEAGIEIDNDISNLYLEGLGGGQVKESYELAMYFMATRAKMDCLEKRGKKGYLFIIGDEHPYPEVKKSQVADVIGDSLEADMPLDEVVAMLLEKFEVFFIIPNMTTYFNDPALFNKWNSLFPERVLKLEDPAALCELIAATIAACEGFDSATIKDHLQEAGTSIVTADSVSKAVSKVGAKTGLKVQTSGAPSGLV